MHMFQSTVDREYFEGKPLYKVKGLWSGPSMEIYHGTLYMKLCVRAMGWLTRFGIKDSHRSLTKKGSTSLFAFPENRKHSLCGR